MAEISNHDDIENNSDLLPGDISLATGSISTLRTWTTNGSMPFLEDSEGSTDSRHQMRQMEGKVELFEDASVSLLSSMEVSGEETGEMSEILLQFQDELADSGEFVAVVDHEATLRWVESVSENSDAKPDEDEENGVFEQQNMLRCIAPLVLYDGEPISGGDGCLGAPNIARMVERDIAFKATMHITSDFVQNISCGYTYTSNCMVTGQYSARLGIYVRPGPFVAYGEAFDNQSSGCRNMEGMYVSFYSFAAI